MTDEKQVTEGTAECEREWSIFREKQEAVIAVPVGTAFLAYDGTSHC